MGVLGATYKPTHQNFWGDEPPVRVQFAWMVGPAGIYKPKVRADSSSSWLFHRIQQPGLSFQGCTITAMAHPPSKNITARDESEKSLPH